MATSITDRLTAAIRIADQSVEQARYQADRNNWLTIRSTLLDARDELGKPRSDFAPLVIPAEPLKLDGRTKEARAARLANG